MAKYRKKPVVIEAVQFNGENSIEIMDFVGKKLIVHKPPMGAEKELDNIPNEAYRIIIPTLEGNMTAYKGDFVIKGIKGEFYPCEPDIFEKTYEPVKP